MAEKIFGLLGRRLGHSWSVPIHTALGCEGYRLIELDPEELEGFLRQPDIGGLNVTIPYKRDVMPFCDIIDPMAQAIGSVNTLTRRADGKLYAFNTDAAGFRWMAERAGISFQSKKAVILGSGGASLTAQACAKAMGAREVVVISRSGPDNYGNLDRHADADIVVNTTPVGMFPNTGVSPVDLAAFPRCSGVLDVVYNPRRTALLLQAEELGIPCSDGLPMLVAQAKAAEEHFFEKAIPDSENERILALLRRECTNIVLIGMPGCGKTTVGQALAALTGREAIDIDQRIVEKAGRSIPEIFAAEGEAAFRALEREVTAEVGKLSGKILLTGGGVVKDRRNYAPLHQNGRIYQLVRNLDALSTDGRPLSQGADLSAMWAERAPLYTAFRDAAMDNNGTVEDTAAAIWRDFCENSGA
ncbi:shikimate kinase [Oscillibacter valericigenes]|uniref:shikimate kinase n=1 Tax=Oscillibacter valericigenes TaxID=351091 RepID=UPI001F27EB3F|nr:shikimate kinase [Oscillibacter valericigenes]MCF2663040.1 shikimate kinase [Oscillibacter valericigenes]